MLPTHNLHVRESVRLIAPRELKNALPMTEASNKTVVAGRDAISAILKQTDPRLLVVLGPCSIHDPVAAHEVAAERAFLRRLGGGCLVPVGARAQFDGGRVRLTGVVADPDGGKLLRDEIAGDAAAGERLGEQLAIRLLDMGAAEILLQQRGSSAHGAS